MRQDILARKGEILEWVEQNKAKAFICRELGCRPETLEAYLKRLNIVYKGNMGLRGQKTDNKYKNALEYAKGNFVHSHKLKNKLIRDGLKKHQCEVCDGTEWLGKKIPIELDHIDGNHYNNTLSNLRIICPNCHAMQDTNSGKNVGRYAQVAQ
jgi:hypothetical protein